MLFSVFVLVPHPGHLAVFLRPSQRPQHPAHPLHPPLSVPQTSLEPALPAGRLSVFSRVAWQRDGRDAADAHVHHSHLRLCDRGAALGAAQPGHCGGLRWRGQEPADAAVHRVPDSVHGGHHSRSVSALGQLYHLLSAQHQVPERALWHLLSALAQEPRLQEQQCDDLSEQQPPASLTGGPGPQPCTHLLTTTPTATTPAPTQNLFIQTKPKTKHAKHKTIWGFKSHKLRLNPLQEVGCYYHDINSFKVPQVLKPERTFASNGC